MSGSNARCCFGSRARGDSDYDLVFLRDMNDWFAEMDRLVDLETSILDKTGGFIHAMPYRAGSYHEPHAPDARTAYGGHGSVKPETTAFVDKAREFLAKAEDMLADGWADKAGRTAYFAGLHAAHGLILERTGKVVSRSDKRPAARDQIQPDPA